MVSIRCNINDQTYNEILIVVHSFLRTEPEMKHDMEMDEVNSVSQSCKRCKNRPRKEFIDETAIPTHAGENDP